MARSNFVREINHMPKERGACRRPAASSLPTGSRRRRPSASSSPTASQRSRRSTAPATPTESIPGHAVPAEILYEIFLRLPVEMLKQLRFACKAWYSLISSLQFRRHHSLCGHQSNALRLLTLRQEGRALHISTSDTRNGDPVVTFSRKPLMPCFDRSEHGTPYSQSCRGLVCIASWSYDNPPILVCNPATEELIELPPTRELALCVRFGYAASAEEFKVVRVTLRVWKTIFEVFTLGRRQWRESRNTPPCNVCMRRAPFLHGALHFLPQIYGGSVKENGHIAVFNLESEEFRGIRLPDFYNSLKVCSNVVHLSVVGESLCLTRDYERSLAKLEMWTLKSYTNAQWVKGYTVDISSVYGCPTNWFWAYLSDSTGDEIIVNCAEKNEHKLLSFDPQTGDVTVKNETEWVAALYEESFCPLRL